MVWYPISLNATVNIKPKK